MKVIINILTFMVAFVFSQTLLPLQCSSFTNCSSCASRDNCVWCNGYNSCLTVTAQDLGNASTQCYNNNGRSLVLLGSGCATCT